MSEKKDLLKELKKAFEEEKERLGFSITYEQANEIAHMEDFVLEEGYVSNQFSRQLINRIIEGMTSWLGELYAWIYPNQMDLIHLNENKTITEEERKEILSLIDKIAYYLRKNKRIAFDGLDPKEEGALIDELYQFRLENYKPTMAKFLKKFEGLWKEEIEKSSKKEALKTPEKQEKEKSPNENPKQSK